MFFVTYILKLNLSTVRSQESLKFKRVDIVN